jgi:nicotinamidase-related amidase
MSNMHKKAFTPENAAMILIDHQIGTMAWTHSSDINLVKKNALRLARIAKAVSIPVVLTASMEDQVQGPLVPELEQILPEAFAKRVKRPGIVNAMHHDGFNKAVRATDLKKLFVAGATTEICVTWCCKCWRKATRCKCRPTRRLHGRSTAASWLCAAWSKPVP